MHCRLRRIGSSSARETNDPSDPAHEMALSILIVMLKDKSFRDDYPLIPRRRHHALLTAACGPDRPQARPRSPRLPHPRPPPLQWIDPDTA